MTGEEIRELLADLAKSQRNFVKWEEDSMRAHRANLKKIEEESAKNLKEIREEAERKHAIAKAETDRLRREHDLGMERLRASQDQTDLQLKELGRKIGGLGEKFGGFTEGMAFPSMEKVLRERFGMEFVSTRVKKRKNGRTIELDVLAYSNSKSNDLYVVEVKSRLREEGCEQLLRLLSDFPRFFPEHRDKRLFGILACVDGTEGVEKRILRSGIYLAKIHDETFSIRVPEGFVPKSYQN